MLELAALAATAVGQFLVPLLTKGADKLTDEVADSTSTAVANGVVAAAKNLWARIRKKFDTGEDKAVTDEDKSVVKLFAANPEAMKAMMELVLKEQLAVMRTSRKTFVNLSSPRRQALTIAPTGRSWATSSASLMPVMR